MRTPRPVRLAGLLISLSALLAAVPAARAQSDSCANAPVIGPGIYSGSTAAATPDGADSCNGSATPDVWYRFAPAQNCVLSVDTCGSGYDTVLSVHSGCPGTVANQIACNDDFCEFQSRVSFNAQGGATYFIRVSGWNGSTGSYVLNVSCAQPLPLNTCAGAPEVGPGSYTGSTVGAGVDGASSCGQTGTTPDHWYKLVPTEACTVRVDTCGSAYDTVLSLHSGCPGSAGNELACNDDACAYQSVVQTFAMPGDVIYVRISGWNGATGAYTLNVSYLLPELADGCSGALEISDGAHLGSTVTATPDGSSSCGQAGARDVWYRYESPADCTLQIDTCDGPTSISVHSACPGTPANQLACSVSGCPSGQPGAQLAVPVTTGQIVYIRVAGAGAGGVGGAFTLTTRCASVGADIVLAPLSQMAQFGRVGDTVGTAVHTPVCNAGTAPLDWFENPDPRHPMQTFNLYRLKDGRLEQIAMSWVKHGFGAAQDNECGLGCIPYPNNTRLGVGCSDTYGPGLNAQQSLIGPRHEVNGWTAAFNFSTSILSNPSPPPLSPIDRRMQIKDADLAPALNPGAQYIAEVYVFSHDDANKMNSVSHVPVAVSGAPGATWNFSLSAGATTTGPAINTWPGATRATAYMPGGADGRCIVASRVTDNGDGTWRYEYGVYNHDLDRGIRAFSVPLRPGIAVTNTGFHAVRSHGEPFSNTPWAAVRSGGAMTWSTEAPSAPGGANPLRWGTMYTFWFDADAPPVDSRAGLRVFRPGQVNRLGVAARAPAAFCAADVDLDGVVNSSDISAFVTGWLASLGGGDLDADFNADGAVNSSDLSAFISAWLAAISGGC